MKSDSQIQKDVLNERSCDSPSQSLIGALLEIGIVAKIQVRPSGSSFITDTQLAETVSSILKSNSTVNEENISIKVEEGCVTLTGEVKKEFQRQSAKIAIQRLAGVRSVVNLISQHPGNKRSHEA